LQLLEDADPEESTVRFNANVALNPITDIYHAHHYPKQTQRDGAVEQARLALSDPLEQQVVMVYRPEFKPQVTRLTTSEAICSYLSTQGSHFLRHFNASIITRLLF